MQFIGYNELNNRKGYPSMAASFERNPYPNKDKIVRFLKSGGEVECARASRDVDVFSGERIPDEVLVMSAGEFMWSNILSWYVDKYNLRLPKNFEDFILKN